MNNATKYQRTHTTYTTIKEVKGEVVETRTVECGNCIWTVINKCNEDNFEEMREKEETLYYTKYLYTIIDNNDTEEEDYNTSFWFLCPETIDKDVEKLNGIVDNDNIMRKE